MMKSRTTVFLEQERLLQQQQLLLKPHQQQQQQQHVNQQQQREILKLVRRNSLLIVLTLIVFISSMTLIMTKYDILLPSNGHANIYYIEEETTKSDTDIAPTKMVEPKVKSERKNVENIQKDNRQPEEENKEEEEKKKDGKQQEKKQQKITKEIESAVKKIKMTRTTVTATTANSSITNEDEEKYWTLKDQEDYAAALKPWANLTTLSFVNNYFFAGYRNQMMAFSALIIDIMQHHPNGEVQILLNTLRHKDVFGTRKKIPHEIMFDVKHWNSFYPKLPRLVSCDPKMHFDYDCENNSWVWGIQNRTAVWASKSPKTFPSKQPKLFLNYGALQQQRGALWTNSPEPREIPNSIDLLMMKDALRLHPKLNAIVEEARQSITVKEYGNSTSRRFSGRAHRLNDNNHGDGIKKSDQKNSIENIDITKNTSGGDINDYMVLHARIEPDMIDHMGTPCIKKKFANLTAIFQMMESKFLNNPPSKVIVLTNMKLLEKDHLASLKKPSTKTLATENANALNSAFKNGLWNGTVKVTQIGTTPILNVPQYAKYKVTIGALINFDLSLNAKYFLGTEVSSFSIDVLRSRFYRGNTNGNFCYRQEGLMEWTNETTTPLTLPVFEC